MNRYKLKCGGRRRKAFLGADGAVMAAATLAAAGMTTAATINSAKSQAKAMIDNAKTQAQSIKDQTNNNNNLQKEQIAFTAQQNKENRQQQQDIQTTLQLLAGQQNMNDRNEQNKVQVRLGGKPKRRTITAPFYGGAQFQVTDGGGVLPIAINPDGYGLYEIIGNDHEHYHKAPGGKNKTGVGIKFKDGSVVEGEGNQNTNQGELMYITPNDAMFISKHSIAGFNPTQAVLQGLDPTQAFNIQESLKTIKGLNDDGSKNKHKSIKRLMGGSNLLFEQANFTQNPNNGTSAIASGVTYASSPVEGYQYKCGGRRTLKCGGKRRKADLGTWFNNNAGAVYNSAGNLLGAGLSSIGNYIAGNILSKAYNQAGSILADAYSQMKGIDMSELNEEDYAAPHTLAVIRQANTNINPQLERIRRNAAAETKEINRGTASSAARLQRLAATNDRMMQRMGEQYAYKDNADEQIKQANAERITQVAQSNADRDVEARRNFGNQRLSLLQYNNNIENAKIAGMAQARADALSQSAGVRASATQSSLSAIGSAIQATGQAFGASFDRNRKADIDFNTAYMGADTSAAVRAVLSFNKPEQAKNLYNQLMANGSEEAKRQANLIADKYKNIIFGSNNVVPTNIDRNQDLNSYSNTSYYA